MPSPVRVVHDGYVDHVWLDSPSNRNALSLAVLADLRAAVRDSAASERCRLLVLDHAGDVFSAGVDVKERRALPPGGPNHSDELAALYRELWDHPKPVACVVDGAARGGALGLLVCADAVFASERSSFAFSEVRVGVAPALVGALAMAKLGSALLAPWLLGGAVFDAAEAARMGLVTRLVPGDGDVREAAEGFAGSIGMAAPGAVTTTKGIVRQVGPRVDELLDEMTARSAALFGSAEAAEGMAAFAERRPPAWVVERPAG